MCVSVCVLYIMHVCVMCIVCSFSGGHLPEHSTKHNIFGERELVQLTLI